MTKTPQNAPRIAAVVLAVYIALFGLIYAAAAGFGSTGGKVAVWSPSVEIDGADSVGDVITVTGNRNTVQRPYAPPQPESRVHKAGEWLGAAFFGLLAVVLAGGAVLLMIQYNKYGWAFLFPLAQKEPE